MEKGIKMEQVNAGVMAQSKKLINYIKAGVEKRNKRMEGMYKLDAVGLDCNGVDFNCIVFHPWNKNKVIFNHRIHIDFDCDWKLAVKDIAKVIQVCYWNMGSYVIEY